MKKTLSPKQAADELGCSASLVYKMFHDGTLQGHRVNTAIRIDEESVRDYIKRHSNRKLTDLPEKYQEALTKSKTAGREPRSRAEKRIRGIWRMMIYRCTRNPRYKSRDIKVCDSWLENYDTFRDWALAHGYEKTLTIDRKNNNGDYTPENCQWATMKQQCRNTRRSRLVTAFGETKPAIAWSEDSRCTVSYETLLSRLRKGQNHEDAITRPNREIHED